MPKFSDFTALVARLQSAAQRLDEQARWLRLAPVAEREWFELISDKLLPQLGDDAFLIAAVVGGTNTGKSVVFNHLAGVVASAASPLASGTKSPVCLIPADFDRDHALAELFGGFRLSPWSGAEEAQRETDEDRLFWQNSAALPDNLLILDTPDIDSDARVNWARADKVRRSADVLIAVLTQQKYNDAAVKQFFRRAASEEKTVIVVFNQCQMPEDEEYWPLWMRTFHDETRSQPAFVYVAPHDRRAADELTLPFYERTWPSLDGAPPSEANPGEMPRSLREDLSRLRFEEIKLRSLGGALRKVVDAQAGAPSWLGEIASRSESVRVISDQLSAERVVEVRGWPVVPFSMVFDEFWTWWKSHRTGWTQNVTTFYDVVNQGVAWPFRAARGMLGGETPRDPVEYYREAEREAILRITEDVYQRLGLLASASGGPVRGEFERLTAGENRRRFVEAIDREHAEADLRDALRRLIAQDMHAFLKDNPRSARWLRRIDVVAVGSRPALSVLLFAVGAHGVDVAAQGLVNLGVDFLAGSAVTVSGDTVFSKAAGGLGAALFARLRALPGRFAEQRAGWLASQLKQQVLGSLPDDLERTARLPASSEYGSMREAVDELRELLEQLETGPPDASGHQATTSTDSQHAR